MKLLDVEAVLFAFGRRVNEDELMNVLKCSREDLQKSLEELRKHYEGLETSLELTNQEDFWKLTVKEDYLELVKDIAMKTELDRPTLETLAVIAFKYPVLQSEVIEERGAGAYEHIGNLRELGYIIKEKSGRSYKLKLTQKFFDYFDLPKEKLKEAFKDIENVAEEIEKQEEQLSKQKEKEERAKKIIQSKKENKTLEEYDS